MGESKATSGADWAVIEPYDSPMEICWNFDYAISAEKLGNLYQKSKRLQWDAMQEMDWDYEVDPSGQLMTTDTSVYMTMPFFKKLSKTQREDFVAHQACHLLSQFLHGEQGALMTASAITHAVPDYDAKLYAATQTMDEARHVEVYEKYINKVGVTYPIMPGLKDIIDVTLKSGNYMKIMVGMNMVIENVRQLRGEVDDGCPIGPDGRRQHTYDYKEGGCRQVKDAEVSANLGWAMPGTGSAMVMVKG